MQRFRCDGVHFQIPSISSAFSQYSQEQSRGADHRSGSRHCFSPTELRFMLTSIGFVAGAEK